LPRALTFFAKTPLVQRAFGGEKSAPTKHEGDSTVVSLSLKARTDLEAIHQEQVSIKTQIQCAIVFSATFFSTAFASFSIPSTMVCDFFSPHNSILWACFKI